jgi:hypothetical protein
MTTNLQEFTKTKPVDKINIRGINVAVWNQEKDEKSFRQITIKKSYKDQESGEIKELKSLNIQDIPYLIQQLQDVYTKEMRGLYES